MKVIVTGASGLLGRAVYHRLKSGGFNVIGTCFSRNNLDNSLIRVDLTNADECKKLINDHQPDILIHCAAERRPDIVEGQPESAYALNVNASHYLAKTCLECANNCVMLVVSTDYVFDGKNPPYSESHQPNPLNSYGKTKWESEQVVLKESDRNIVFRVPILYGQVEYVEESAVTVLFPKVKNVQEKCLMSNYERRYPTHTADIADCLANFITKLQAASSVDSKQFSGIFHFSNSEEMTKYDMALAMAEVFHINKDHIIPDDNPSGGTSRPYNSQLACLRLQQLGLMPNQFISFRQGILQALKPFAEK